ncbi:hypothetical protein HY546_00755 [archaeon]|nr:hypothetical protein [archaeon]
MDNRIKALIVLVALVLSMGPLGFFGGSPKPINVSDDRPQQLYEPVSADVVGYVENIVPTLVYKFSADELNEPLVRRRLSTIPSITNYSISSGLNPFGNGYQYVVRANLDNVYSSIVVGFKMVYRLSDFAYQSNSSFPMLEAKVVLLGNFTAKKLNGGDVRVNTQGNRTVTATLYYWNRNMSSIPIRCPSIIISSATGVFLRSSELCVDVIQPSQILFGLPADYLNFVEERRASMGVNVTNLIQQHFEGKVAEDANESRLNEIILPAYDPSEYRLHITPNATAEELPSFKLDVPVKSENELVVARNALSKSGFRTLSEWRVGEIAFNEQNVTIGLFTYDLAVVNNFGNVFAKLKKDTLLGEKQLEITFGIILDEIVSVIGEEA